MENYLISYTTGEKLRRNGYTQEAQFYSCSDLGEITFSKNCEPYKKSTCGKHLARPMAEELLDQLPPIIRATGGMEYYLEIGYTSYGTQKAVSYVALDNVVLVNKSSTKLANALAEMWLWLRNKGYPLPNGLNISRPS